MRIKIYGHLAHPDYPWSVGKLKVVKALKSIEQEWKDFAAKVIPTIAPESVQYREMKNSFFAGAFVVSTALEQIGANPNITESITSTESIARQ